MASRKRKSRTFGNLNMEAARPAKRRSRAPSKASKTVRPPGSHFFNLPKELRHNVYLRLLPPTTQTERLIATSTIASNQAHISKPRFKSSAFFVNKQMHVEFMALMLRKSHIKVDTVRGPRIRQSRLIHILTFAEDIQLIIGNILVFNTALRILCLRTDIRSLSITLWMGNPEQWNLEHQHLADEPFWRTAHGDATGPKSNCSNNYQVRPSKAAFTRVLAPLSRLNVRNSASLAIWKLSNDSRRPWFRQYMYAPSPPRLDKLPVEKFMEGEPSGFGEFLKAWGEKMLAAKRV
ncbi:hypothetical protein EJ08DRAFT_696846 [Tothia fuscella]|uniref:F-box domain-containing protein n=1 Tax=Tothia fuscella TaxID=1048955 RepID=A0A9P4TZH2_9PEZI|nr:hypothetical protein EJ08DRAFT_696846 [Tothia fuscella]